MAEILTPDLCVIGAGAGGLAAATAAAAHGATVVLVERGEMGGTRLNYGCIPSKALIEAGRQAQLVREAARFGVLADEPRINFGKLYDHVHQVVGTIAPSDAAERLSAKGITVIRAHAEFTDPKTLKAGDQAIAARRFVIASGSRPALPAIPGIETVKVLSNETVFEETHKPGRMIVIGAGAMGLEIAQAHHRLGTNVIVVDAGEPLGREDPEMAAIVLRQLREEGLDIRAHTNVTVVAARGHGVAVTIEKAGVEEVLNGSHLLVAAGRLPATGELGLEKARVAFGPGGIKVDAGLRTTNRRIYAVGDVNGSPAYSYVAQHQGEAVVRNALFGLPASARLETVPFVTYTDPEIASVGMTELQAGRRRSAGFRVLRQSLAENDRALSTRAAEGLVKVVFDARGQVRGASIVGPHAGELITLYAFAIANRLTARHLAGFVAPYPTLSETARQIATAYGKGQPDNPWLTRLAALVRLLP